MKINILTQPLYCNYGGILQNYALQQVLKEMGHEPLTINVPVKRPHRPVNWKDYVKTVLNFGKRVSGKYHEPFLNPRTLSRKEFELSVTQSHFIERHINKVDENAPFTSDVCQKYPAEAWVVGSDQIWRPWCSFHIENCFFDFIEDSNVRKIAYAASFGTDRWEIDKETTERLKPLIKRFNGVSVREKAGINLCETNLDHDAILALDPTLLLEAKDYLRLLSSPTYSKSLHLAEYVLDMNKFKHKQIKKECKLYKLELNKIGRMHKDRFDSVESWIDGIANASRVITDSFHGTVFSIIFDKPVKILTNDVRGNARLDSLIHTLGLTTRADGYYRLSDDSKNKLADYRKKSLDFLYNALRQP